MSSFEATVVATSVDDGKATALRFEVAYVMSWWIIGPILGATIMKYQLKKVGADVLEGIDRHLASGEIMGAGVNNKNIKPREDHVIIPSK